MKIIIPARRGSKGFPFKNRKLFDETARTLIECRENVTVFSNDEVIEQKTKTYGFDFLRESNLIAGDNVSPKEFMTEAIRGMDRDEIVIMLYLTYPQRNKSDITRAWEFFAKNNSNSMLCSKKIFVSPYLMIKDGKQVMKHNLYRRQDYPECSEISHFICIFRVSELPRLNLNMYNENTLFMPIRTVIDVDTEKDYNDWREC